MVVKDNNLNDSHSYKLPSPANDFSIDETYNYLSPSFIGHMIPLRCGHTGQPSNEEAYLMEKHLRAAGFVM